MLLGEAGLFLHHAERSPGGHALKLLGCQLVIDVEEVKDLRNSNKVIIFPY